MPDAFTKIYLISWMLTVEMKSDSDLLRWPWFWPRTRATQRVRVPKPSLDSFEIYNKIWAGLIASNRTRATFPTEDTDIYLGKTNITWILMNIYIYKYKHKFALIKYALECASDVGCCMKPAKTIGDSQKNDTFFVCAYLRVLWCGHTVCLQGRVVFSLLDPLHHEWVCPCDFTWWVA